MSPSPMAGMSARLRSAKGAKHVLVEDMDSSQKALIIGSHRQQSSDQRNTGDSERSRKFASIHSGSIKRPIPQSNFYLNAMQLKHIQEQMGERQNGPSEETVRPFISQASQKGKSLKQSQLDEMKERLRRLVG